MVEVTDKSAFEEGSLGIQVVLFVVTLGLYGLYWYYQANSQLVAGTDAEFNPAVRVLLSLIPLVGLYWSWQFCDDMEGVTGHSGALLFVLYLFFMPAAWFLIQTGINETAAA